MRTVVCQAPGRLTLEQRAAPSCGPGEALLRIRRVGVCGTDIHAYGGNQPYFTYPRVLGHELAGEIVAVGDGVHPARVGQQAYVIPYLHCGECRACRRGRTNCCRRMQVIGVHRDGGMCDTLAVPADHLVSDTSLSLDQLALVECLAIGAHAVRRSELDEGELAVVVGAGPIGMGVAQLARERGARVVMVDTNAERLAFCRERLGITETLNPAEQDVPAALAALGDGELADVVFDATGSPAAMCRGFDLVAHAGRYVLVSIVKADIAFHDPDFHGREMTLLASRNATREDFDTVCRLMAAGRLEASAMITHRAELDALTDRLPAWCVPGSGVVKAMIELEFPEHAEAEAVHAPDHRQ
ncbi:zinc-binding alcohol dehydrogenase family protein [Halomonas sp. PGE1]|uniref:zinc-binding alcohol dehydrogenase family protein n=1 Tax=Halomonas sp. PGE1 TaxID=2730360 RepID=UPI0014749EED|nr:zinc-binding alcohol dehydrogenase family protein [Halomonas sp. PGE1]QJQ99044.1 zinc-binding alcohol dehydrogenase family protein [Halomonas sp. PGE1]